MNRTTKQLYISIFISMLISLAFAIGWSFELQKSKEQKAIHEQNLSALTANYDSLKTREGKLALEKNILQVKYSDLSENVLPQMQAEIYNLNIKLKRAEVYSQTITLITDTITIHTHDTIIKQIANDKLQRFDTLYHFNYHDHYTHISGLGNDSTIKLTYSITDTLVQVVYKAKREKWWKIFSPRPLKQRITTKNTNTKIIYNELIKIEK